MANIVFNIAKGRVVEYYNRVKSNDPANSALILVPIETSGLEADATLMAMLPGGVHAGRVTNVNTPTAYDSTTGELLPCIRIRVETEVPMGFASEQTPGAQYLPMRTPVALYFLRQENQAALAAPMARAFAIMQGARLAGVHSCVWSETVAEATEDTLQLAQSMQRYYLTRMAA